MTGKMKSTGIDKTTNMNWYIYWYYVNVYFFRILIGWMRRGMGRGLAFYMLLSFSPLYALYALPVMVAVRYFGMTTVYNQYIFWVLIFGVPVIHLSIFYPGSKRDAKWENEYRRTCTDGKNLLAILFSLCCIVAAGVLLFVNHV